MLWFKVDKIGCVYVATYSDSLQAGRSGDRIQVGARFSAPVQTGRGAHPASYTKSTGSFPGVKVAGAWCWPSTPSIAEVKERVELYLYSPSGPVLGWTVPLCVCCYLIYIADTQPVCSVKMFTITEIALDVFCYLIYRGADKSLARRTSRCILFDG
jgi:hypothetical protein